MIEKLIFVVACHLIGDYVLQSNYIAMTKGENWYNLFVHSFLYCVPFIIMFGIDWRFCLLFVFHIIIDSLKARYNKIDIVQDQIFHYAIACCYLI